MNILKIQFVGLFFASVLMVPNATSAWFSTHQDAVRIDSESVLYTVTYKFGMEKSDLHMPILAERNTETAHTPLRLGYTILKDSKTQFDVGDSYGIVLSDAKIVGDTYFVPRGTAKKFTFVALLKVPVADTEVYTDLDLAMQVTSLPFVITRDGAQNNNKLNPSELTRYITPEVELK